MGLDFLTDKLTCFQSLFGVQWVVAMIDGRQRCSLQGNVELDQAGQGLIGAAERKRIRAPNSEV
jgi:hypothetical protein